MKTRLASPWIGVGALVLTAAACRPEAKIDEASMCFLAADERLEVQVWESCASDHRDAELSCAVEAEPDGSLRLTAEFVDGKDPNGACADALVATCESEPLAAGMHVVHYGEESFTLTVPGDPDPNCADVEEF
jgi:hypothetical protein